MIPEGTPATGLPTDAYTLTTTRKVSIKLEHLLVVILITKYNKRKTTFLIIVLFLTETNVTVIVNCNCDTRSSRLIRP